MPPTSSICVVISIQREYGVSSELFITTKTVEYHLSNIFAKLGVSNRTEAVRVALQNGMT